MLPAYIIGMVMAGFFKQYKETLVKMRAKLIGVLPEHVPKSVTYSKVPVAVIK